MLALLVFGALYIGWARPRLLHWGARDTEVDREFPGDGIVVSPRYTTTRAVSISAPPEQIWPWLVQMGYQRGGLYSYDWLDQLFGYLDRPSADRILPAFQHLEPGDVIPIGNGPDWPVYSVETYRHLILNPHADDFSVTWAFILEPFLHDETRLISRLRAVYPTGLATTILVPLLLEPAAFLMERRMLMGIKERAERINEGKIE